MNAVKNQNTRRSYKIYGKNSALYTKKECQSGNHGGGLGKDRQAYPAPVNISKIGVFQLGISFLVTGVDTCILTFPVIFGKTQLIKYSVGGEGGKKNMKKNPEKGEREKNMKKIKYWSLKRSDLKRESLKNLKIRALELHTAIYVAECFGCSDLVEYDWIIEELERRGYDINETSKLAITKI